METAGETNGVLSPCNVCASEATSRSAGVLLSPWLYHGLRLGLGGLFLWAGGAKLSAPKAFAGIIYQYGLVPDSFLVPAAIGLPLVEIVGGLGLVLNRRWATGLVAGLIGLFLAVLGFALFNQMEVDCGCFSPEERAVHENLWWVFWRDVGLMAITAYLWVWRRTRRDV